MTISSISNKNQISCYSNNSFHGTSHLDNSFTSLSFKEKLIKIGMIDSNGILLFIPKNPIMPLKDLGITRWNKLLVSDINCLTKNKEKLFSISQSEYIIQFRQFLKERGVIVKSYLRGGYSAYVICFSNYLEDLIQEYLTLHNFSKDLLNEEIAHFKAIDQFAKPPNDIDWIDIVESNSIPSTALKCWLIEFLVIHCNIPGGFQKMKNEGFFNFFTSKSFSSDYICASVGGFHCKTDRVVGRLEQKFIFTRDDCCLEFQDINFLSPQSTENFWQTVIDRQLKIIRTEIWHEKDFRLGLTALQCMDQGHELIEDKCSLQKIINSAFLTESSDVSYYAIERAKLHLEEPLGFLLSVFFHFSMAPDHKGNALEMLKEKIYLTLSKVSISEKFSSLIDNSLDELFFASLYQLALLFTVYEDTSGEYRATWDECGKGFLTFHVREFRIIFPKNHPTSNQTSFFLTLFEKENLIISKVQPLSIQKIYKWLENNKLVSFDRILLELALQKPLTPLSNSFINALVDYFSIAHDYAETIFIARLLQPWLVLEQVWLNNVDWIKALVRYSYRHGMKLWRLSKMQMIKEVRCLAAEEIYTNLGPERLNIFCADLEVEAIPCDLKEKIFNTLIKTLNPQDFTNIIQLIKPQNRSFVSACINHFFFKIDKKRYISDPYFQKILTEILNCSCKIPSLSHKLIPFFSDLAWVRETYGGNHALNKTIEWAMPLKSKNQEIINEILHYNELLYPHFQRLKSFLFVHSKKKNEKINLTFANLIKLLFNNLMHDKIRRLIHFKFILEILKLGYLAQVLSIDEYFEILQKLLAPALLFPFRGEASLMFDPIKHHLNHVNCIDFTTFDQWNEKRNSIFNNWIEYLEKSGHLPHKKHANELSKNGKLEVLSLETLCNIQKFSSEFKILFIKFIEKKISLETLKLEILLVYKDVVEKLPVRSTEIENPCLICIEELTFLLKNLEQRKLTYQAFFCLLEIEDPLLVMQYKNYFQTRQQLEEKIILAVPLLRNGKISYTQFLETCKVSIKNFITSNYSFKLTDRDPILDALNLDCLSPDYNKVLLKVWYDFLNSSEDEGHRLKSEEVYTYYLAGGTTYL